MSPEEVHAFLVAAAARPAPALSDALVAAGPSWFPEREDRGLALHLARAIVGQQLSARAALSIWAGFEAAGGAASPAGFLCAENAATLRACGLSANKVKALVGIGQAAAEGRLDAALVRAMDHKARSAHLCAPWGIGQWTADMVSIFYCRDEDVWPASDTSVQRAFARYIGRRQPARTAERFAPYRSILALHMWRLLDGPP